MKEAEKRELESLADEIIEAVKIHGNKGKITLSTTGTNGFGLSSSNIEGGAITLEMPGESMVNHPRHYNKGKYECLEVVKELIKDMNGVEGALFFNVFKYLWRYPDKNGVEDLKKCEFYLKDLIALNENI